MTAARIGKSTIYCCFILILLAPLPLYSAPGKTVELSLAAAVQTALDNNLDLKLSALEVISAKGAVQASEAPFDTQLTADIGYYESATTPVSDSVAENEQQASWAAGLQKRFSPGTALELSWRNEGIETEPNFYFSDPLYRSGLTLSLSQPLLKGFGSEVQEADLKTAQSGLAATSYQLQSDAADLAAEVKNAYWELVYAHQNREVLQLALALAQKLRDETAAKIAAGKFAEIDIYQPESEVARREEELISGERAIGVAEDAIKLLMNSTQWLTPIVPKSTPDTSPLHPNLKQVLENALQSRADLKALEMKIKSDEYQLHKAKNATLPDLSLVGQVGVGGGDDTYGGTLDASLHDADTQWQIGLQLTHSLDNSLAEGQLQQAEAALRKSHTRLELLKQNIRKTIRVTVRDIELALKALEATNKTALATEKRLQAEQIKFAAGRSTTLDVLIAQQDYSAALSAESRTRVIYAQTVAELDRIQGLVTLPPE